MKNLIRNLSLITLVHLSSSVFAYELTDTVQLHGFASQGYVFSPDNPYGGEQSKDGSFDYREFGLNGSWEATNKLRFAGQLLSRTMADAADGEVKVDFLLADYLAFSDGLNSFGVRIGRIKNPLGVYNSTRDIPGNRPGVTVPSAIYFDSFRDAVLATDGVSFYGNHALEMGDVNWNIYTGKKALEGTVIENYMFAKDIQGKVKDVAIKGLNIGFTPKNQQQLNFGLSLLDVAAKLSGAQSINNTQNTLLNSPAVTSAATDAATTALTPVAFGGLGYTLGSPEFNQYVGLATQNAAAAEAEANFADYISGAELHSLVAVASVQYGYRDWLFTAEYMNIFNDITFETAGVENVVRPTTEAFSIQAEWFITPTVHSMIRYEELYLSTKDKKGVTLQRVNDPSHGFGKGLTLGTRWLIDENWTLAGELSRNEGTAWVPVFDGIENVKLTKYWNTYSMQLTYQF